MKQLVRNLKIALAVLLVVALALGGGVVWQQRQSQAELLSVAGENRTSLRQRYAQAGEIISADGAVLAYSEDGERLYHEDSLVNLSFSQLVGDFTHHMSNTIETLYQDELLGNLRSIPEQFLLDVTGRGLQGSDVHLTLHSGINSYAYEQLAGLTGSAVLMNYETGEILAMVSTPATTTQNIVDYTNIPDSALFNRALNGRYAPGSTFKILNSAAWLSSPVFDPTFQIVCDGSAHHLHGATDVGHGPVDLNGAFTTSCNVFYGDLAVMMGQSFFSDYLADAGLGELTSVDRLTVSSARQNSSAASMDDGLLSWFGTGQPVGELVLTMTPLELATIGAAVANGGNLLEPHVVDYIENPLNQRKEEAETEVRQRMFSPQVAARLQQLMTTAISSENTIQSNARIEGFEVGGKSGTVQVETADGEQKNSLWVGYLNDEDFPYAVAVVVENSGATNGTAVLMGANILREATRYE